MADFKIILLLVLSLGFVPELSAQFSSSDAKRKGNVNLGEAIDSSRYEMLYVVYAKDPAIGEEKFEIRIMQVGDSARRDVLYADYRVDSVLWKIHEPTMEMGQVALIFNTCRNVPGETNSNKYLWNKGVIVEHPTLLMGTTRNGVTSYCTYDSTAIQEWELLDDVDVILGIECKKARTHFRGRDWTAWYATDIPYSAGPWKFGGLPGLIVKAEDSTGEYRMEAGMLRNGTGVILKKLTGKEQVVSRKKMAELFRLENEYPFRTVPLLLQKDGTPGPRANERGFYNPIERTLD